MELAPPKNTHTHTHTHTMYIYIYTYVCMYVYIYIYTASTLSPFSLALSCSLTHSLSLSLSSSTSGEKTTVQIDSQQQLVREREEVERRALLLYAEQYAQSARRYFPLSKQNMKASKGVGPRAAALPRAAREASPSGKKHPKKRREKMVRHEQCSTP
jgi:hypothetical protein